MNYLRELILKFLRFLRGPVGDLHDLLDEKLEILRKSDDPRMKWILEMFGNRSFTDNLQFLVITVGVLLFFLIIIAAYAYFIIDHIVRFVFRLG